jgi:alanine racemase
VDVFVKIDTGMNRLGFRPEALRRVLDALRACRNAGEVTLMTHFACADDARGIDWQLDAFRHATTGLALPLSLANSATLLRYPHAASGWARLGIMLYGASPFAEESAHALGLRPAMTLASRIIAVRELAAGESVGYGALFHAREAMRIGVVACGYADGYPRHAPTGTPVLVAGERTRLIGRVSMDMLCVDLSGLPQAQVGASVVLWGEGLPVEEVAQAAGTVSYELLCALAPRVPVVEIE